MIRQFTIIPALLGIAALGLIGCSAEEESQDDLLSCISEHGYSAYMTGSCQPLNSPANESTASGEATILEGTWLGNCEPSFAFFTQGSGQWSGSSYVGELKTYSDSECTNKITGSDVRVVGTNTKVTTGPTITTELNGKSGDYQLTKIESTFEWEYTEGLAAAFYPPGTIYDNLYYVYIEGDKMYTVDGGFSYLTKETTEPTTIDNESFWIKQ
jgi:hypothetical protein